MDIFYIIVLVVSIIILVIILTLIGVMINNTSHKSGVYPPVIDTCPDYWTFNHDISACVVPSNNKINIGTIYDISNSKLLLNDTNTPGMIKYSPSGELLTTSGWAINFGDGGWNKGGVSPICNQKIWSNTYSITFDGVSNYNSC